MSEALLDKARVARAERAVMVTTPASVKACMLTLTLTLTITLTLTLTLTLGDLRPAGPLRPLACRARPGAP